MENKLISLILKVSMGVLFLIGFILIWNNISLAPGSDEDIALTDQSFFVVEHQLGADDDGKRQEAVKEVFYSYVVDAKAKLVYDLDNMVSYELDAFVNSNGAVKNQVSEITDENTVNELIIKNYEFQNATQSSISYTYWLMFAAFIAIIGFTFVNIAKDPKRFIVTAIGVIGLVIITIICYYAAETAGVGKMLETSNYTDQAFHYTGTGLMITWALILVSVGLILFQAIVSLGRFFSK